MTDGIALFESHYKLKITTPDPRLNDAVWEKLTYEARPDCVWGPINGQYQFSYCQAVIEKLRIDDEWDSKERGFWELFCCERPKRFRETAPTSWTQNYLLRVPYDQVLILRSDTPKVDEVLLIEEQFLEPIIANFRPNKFGIPIKPCRKVTHLNFKGDPYGWCAIHHQGILNGRNNCDRQIPHQYLPCDVENDQAGPYCHTHGGDIDDYEDHCKSYRGPLEDNDGDKDIPNSYENCHYWTGLTCSHHQGTKLEGRDYCNKYDGPLLFVDPT